MCEVVGTEVPDGIMDLLATDKTDTVVPGSAEAANALAAAQAKAAALRAEGSCGAAGLGTGR